MHSGSGPFAGCFLAYICTFTDRAAADTPARECLIEKIVRRENIMETVVYGRGKFKTVVAIGVYKATPSCLEPTGGKVSIDNPNFLRGIWLPSVLSS